MEAVVRALQTGKNGFIYGSRLRFAHSLVISVLFRPNIPLNKRLRVVWRTTLKHGELLLVFGFCYKLALLQLKNCRKGVREFLSGAIGGLLVYSGVASRYNNAISQQITLYCGSRVMLGLGKYLAHLIASKKVAGVSADKIQNTAWAVYATLVWATVMCLHAVDPHLLQKSLTHSMDYIYMNDHSEQVSAGIRRLISLVSSKRSRD